MGSDLIEWTCRPAAEWFRDTGPRLLGEIFATRQ
jgi:hypothetical protein